jgi:CheY-like chemotaxis protein
MGLQTSVPGNGRLGHILVVDDIAAVRKPICMALFDVVEAEDGEKGIAAIKADGNALLVDAIICDLYMPRSTAWRPSRTFARSFRRSP